MTMQGQARLRICLTAATCFIFAGAAILVVPASFYLVIAGTGLAIPAELHPEHFVTPTYIQIAVLLLGCGVCIAVWTDVLVVNRGNRATGPTAPDSPTVNLLDFARSAKSRGFVIVYAVPSADRSIQDSANLLLADMGVALHQRSTIAQALIANTLSADGKEFRELVRQRRS